MTASLNKTVKIIAVVLVAALLSGNVFAVNNNLTNKSKTEIPEVFTKNLAVGIASSNMGLKTSCIYYAGFYEIEELVKPLVEQLAKETNPNTRILIALALYKIGNAEAMDAVKNFAKNDNDPAVQKIANAILTGSQDIKSYSDNLNFSNK